jgi:photosystem II stability/assembly factor-like uncharacterized protein
MSKLITACFFSIVLSSTIFAQGFWTNVSPYFYTCFAENPSGNIFAGSVNFNSETGGGVLKSIDNGNNWVLVSNGIGDLRISAIASNSNGILIVGTYSGVYRSTNNGVNWSSTSLTTWRPTDAKGYLNYLYVIDGYNCNGFARSSDEGATWTVSNSGLSTCDNGIAVNPNSGFIFIASGTSGIFRSTDNGNSWQNKLSNPSNFVPIIVTSNGAIFAGTVSNGCYRSTNNGDNWTQCPGLPITNVHALTSSSTGVIFAGSGTNGDVYQSTDNGNSWTQTNTSFTYGNVYKLFCSSNNYVYCGLLGLILRSNSPTFIAKISSKLPSNVLLYQNYPDPFNPSTNIKFDIPKSSQVTLTIYDVLGKEVTKLVNEELKPGGYSVDWNGSDYSSGVYFYKLQTGEFAETKRMILIK